MSKKEDEEKRERESGGEKSPFSFSVADRNKTRFELQMVIFIGRAT